MNELIVLDKIEKRLRAKREPVVFPLTPTHRKELRDLRNVNIGSLNQRLKSIKQLKREEYKKKYWKDVQGEIKELSKACETLNSDWKERIKHINKILVERKKFEESMNIEHLNLNHSYDNIAELKEVKEVDREYKFNVDTVSNEVLEKEFKEQYGKMFEKVSERIDDVNTKYEEAINFGDLEIVKELYYTMKTADKFFEGVSKIDV